jgi:hypothetical protein
MKKYLFGVLLGGISTGALAQAYYEPIPYYGNNPFIFCTVGVPQDCWFPISKELGTFGISNHYCFNAYSALLFARVCPRAFGPAAAAGGKAAAAAGVAAGVAAGSMAGGTPSNSSSDPTSGASADSADASPRPQVQPIQVDPATQSLD